MIARLGAGRKLRCDGHRGGSAHPQRNGVWTKGEPVGSGTRDCLVPHDLRTAAEVEGEPGSAHVDDDSAAAGVRHANRRSRRPRIRVTARL